MTNSQILPAVSIKTRILFSFLVVILTLSVSIALLGYYVCLLYTSDAADDLLCVVLGGRRITKKKKQKQTKGGKLN